MRLFFGLLLFLNFSVEAQDIFDAARKGDIERMRSLAAISPDTLNAKNEHGFTPLVLAAYRNQPDAVEFLIKSGIDVTVDTPEGSALMGACFTGNMEIAEQLIKAGAFLNEQNANGETPLHFAVMSGNQDLIWYLLEMGAYTKTVNNTGQRPGQLFEKSLNKKLWKRLQ